ncbi:MAG: RNA 2',3'-cyclic phosphodiesterase [Planctomycetes bacterium]|nr:RNA 2',3'-cyclic phosphodiesterase [Planctomycetota bacterium]
MEPLRLFVALNLSAATRGNLVSVQEELPPGIPVNWVAFENIHLTLRFLGETPPERLEAARAALEEATVAWSAPRLVVHGLGAFLQRRVPRVLWAGAEDGAGVLAGLADSLEQALAGRGFPRERERFVPHVTLGRIRSKPGSDRKGAPGWAGTLRAFLEYRRDRRFGEETVAAASLMRSVLGPRGPHYEELAQARLGDRRPDGAPDLPEPQAPEARPESG